MEYKTITAVGIDVSKGKSTIAVRRPGGEVVLVPFQVNHDAAGLSGLVKTLCGIDGDIRVVMEHTGMYWRPIALALKEAGFFVSVVNAMLIHDFSDNSLRKSLFNISACADWRDRFFALQGKKPQQS